MSYSKGWSLIRTAERETGYTIVDRSPGGKGGGAARVSERGRKLLEQYERFEKEIARIAREKYGRFLSEDAVKMPVFPADKKAENRCCLLSSQRLFFKKQSNIIYILQQQQVERKTDPKPADGGLSGPGSERSGTA